MHLRLVEDVAVVLLLNTLDRQKVSRAEESLEVQTICPAQTIASYSLKDALDKVKTTYVTALCATDILLPEHLFNLISLKSDVAYCQSIVLDETGQEKTDSTEALYSVLIKTNILRELGGFPQTWSDTLKFLVREGILPAKEETSTYITVLQEG